MRISRLQFVDRCLSEAIAATIADRRDLRRLPFFRPITISCGSEQRDSVPGFCRDVSRGGMGLLHAQPLEVDSSITVGLPRGSRHLQLASTLKWCSEVGEGLYYSGCSFDGLSAGTSLALVSAVVREELNRRVQQRYPFFRPATLCFGTGEEQPVYCRDISRGGMGLMFRQPVRPGRVVIHVEAAKDTNVAISLDIRWCVPAIENWYLGGSKFATVWLEEVPAKLL